MEEAGREVLPLHPPEGDIGKAVVSYNIRYSKELQKRIKRFCIENEGIDMKDVFTQGAIMFMDRF